MLEENLRFIFIRWSTSDEMDHSARRKELGGVDVGVEDCFEVESISFKMGNVHLEKFNPPAQSFSKELE